MAPPARLTPTLVTLAAIELVDTRGFDSLTLSAVAEDLDVATSALYTHCRGLDGLRHLVAIAATNNLTATVRNAAIGTAGSNALNAIGLAYRTFALAHPGQFASTLRPPESDDDDLADANASLLDVFTLVYAATGLTSQDSLLAARSIRSAIHGFLALEHCSGTTEEHPIEFQYLLDALQRGLSA
ncbi:MAG: TetR-like C-terminal domain-containing protein [Acidimicrobiales bacterium]